MIITHNELISRGFTLLTDRPNHYAYKNVLAQLEPTTGRLHIRDFKVPLTQMSDLNYFLEVIDYLLRATVVKSE